MIFQKDFDPTVRWRTSKDEFYKYIKNKLSLYFRYVKTTKKFRDNSFSYGLKFKTETYKKFDLCSQKKEVLGHLDTFFSKRCQFCCNKE